MNKLLKKNRMESGTGSGNEASLDIEDDDENAYLEELTPEHKVLMRQYIEASLGSHNPGHLIGGEDSLTSESSDKKFENQMSLVDKILGEKEPENTVESEVHENVDDNDDGSGETRPETTKESHYTGRYTMRSDNHHLGVNISNFAPLTLQKVFGRNEKLGVTNLVGFHQSRVIYPASNVIVIYDFFTNRQNILQGHRNAVTCVTSDKNNIRYYASGDKGPGCCIIIWDLFNGHPFKTILSPHYEKGVDFITFVRDQDILASIGPDEHESSQEIWLWDFKNGEEISDPKITIKIPLRAKNQYEIIFSPDPRYFATTGDHSVVFYTWIQEESYNFVHIPIIPNKFLGRMQKFTASLWMTMPDKSHVLLTATEGGHVILWEMPTPMGLQEKPDPNKCIREFRRCYKLSSDPITCFIEYNEYFVIGESSGGIKFFDRKFRLVRWTKSSQMSSQEQGLNMNLKMNQSLAKSVVSISFNGLSADQIPEFKLKLRDAFPICKNPDQLPQPQPRSYYPKTPQKGQNTASYPGSELSFVLNRDQIISESQVKDHTFGGYKYRQPSQTTICREKLNCPDFIISFGDGSCGYYHIAEGRCDTVVPKSLGKIVAMDCMPLTSQIAMCNKSGDLQMYDFIERKLLYSGRIFQKNHKISCLKFHPSGAFAFVGTEEGQIYFRRAFTWDSSSESPLDNGTSGIGKILFSPDGLIMAHSDNTNALSVYHYSSGKSTWVLRGKQRQHFREIVDILFFPDEHQGVNRLFTLSTDRRLVEYEVIESHKGQGLKILSIVEIEQESSPLAMTIDYPFQNGEPYLLFSNEAFKLRYLSLGKNDKKVRKTCQGPVYGEPISKLFEITIPGNDHQQMPARYLVFICGNRIGLGKGPVDGNPYRFMALLGHPSNITQAILSNTGSEIFTIAQDDNCTFMWTPNPSVLESSIIKGGSGLEPFKHLLDSGLKHHEGQQNRPSWYLDLENCFYYFMLKRVSSQAELYKLDTKLPLGDIPTLVRTCGYFPTEYEVDLLIEEIVHKGQVESGERSTHIDLEDFIILFTNHRPWPAGKIYEELRHAFEILGDLNEKEELYISKEEFREYLTTKGEVFNENDLPQFLPQFIKTWSDLDRSKSNFTSVSTILNSNNKINAGGNYVEDTTPSTEEIKVTEFIDTVVPKDSVKPINWSPDSDDKGDGDKERDFENKIKRIQFFEEPIPLMGSRGKNSIPKVSQIDPEKVQIELTERRNMLRYYQKMIDSLKSTIVPMNEKLLAVFEMDFLAKHGRFPNKHDLRQYHGKFGGSGSSMTDGDFDADNEGSSELSSNVGSSNMSKGKKSTSSESSRGLKIRSLSPRPKGHHYHSHSGKKTEKSADTH